jgi:hypothetical protein
LKVVHISSITVFYRHILHFVDQISLLMANFARLLKILLFHPGGVIFKCLHVKAHHLRFLSAVVAVGRNALPEQRPLLEGLLSPTLKIVGQILSFREISVSPIDHSMFVSPSLDAVGAIRELFDDLFP